MSGFSRKCRTNKYNNQPYPMRLLVTNEPLTIRKAKRKEKHISDKKKGQN